MGFLAQKWGRTQGKCVFNAKSSFLPDLDPKTPQKWVPDPQKWGPGIPKMGGSQKKSSGVFQGGEKKIIKNNGKNFGFFGHFSFKIPRKNKFLGKPWGKSTFFCLKFVEKMTKTRFHEVRRRPLRFRPITTLGALKNRSFLTFFGGL